MLEVYRARISGPLLDRIDLQIEVPSLAVDVLPARRDGLADGDTCDAITTSHVAEAIGYRRMDRT